MSIPKWLAKAAEECTEKLNVNFSDPIYEKFLGLYNEGKLDEGAERVVEEIEYLRDVMNHAVAKLSLNKEAKEGAPADELSEPVKSDKTDKLLEVPPTPPSGKPVERKMLPGRVKEPETTKWKEIRFNKRTGTWQCVITTRMTRNFLSENEAVEFTKKANLSKDETNR